MTSRVQPGAILHPPPDPLSAVILCENSALATVPLQSVQSLSSRFCGDLEIQASVWQFDALSMPAIEVAATKSATAAALIGIASSNPAELPLVVRSVLTRSLTARLALPTALMLFFRRDRELRSGESQASNVFSYLRHLAWQAGAAFFVTEIPGPLEMPATAPTLPPEAARPIPFPPLTDPWQHHSPVPRQWGLNE